MYRLRCEAVKSGLFSRPALLIQTLREESFLSKDNVGCAWCKETKPVSDTTWFMPEPGEKFSPSLRLLLRERCKTGSPSPDDQDKWRRPNRGRSSVLTHTPLTSSVGL